jgi:hypothetical protein
MKAELKVFSGRPNPRWFLAPEDIADLSRVLLRLPHHISGLPPLQVLGYRGIVLTNESPSETWTDIVVYHEWITVRFQDRTDYLIDDERVVENLLLDAARGHVADALLERIRAERQSTEAS